MIKRFVKSILKRIMYGAKVSSEAYIEMLLRYGIEIGEGTVFFDPINTVVDTQNPKLLKIGRKVLITSGVKILTHDYSWAVLTELYGECVGGVSPVIIGNNIFIGVNTVILKGTEIGDNTIIGASSVCSGKLEGGYVYAGVPARKIMSIDEFYMRRRSSRDENIVDIIHMVGESEDKWKYLREYSTHIEECPPEIVSDLLHSSGAYDKALAYYTMDSSKIHIDNILEKEE